MLPNTAAKCEPGKLYLVDCNTCLCLDNGNLFCEKLLCLNQDEENTAKAKKWSGSPCKKGDDTLSTRCIRCSCVNGATKCYPVLGCVMPKVQKLHGNSKIRLNLEEDCEPGAIYKIDCNKCYCQSDLSLRCTQKSCLNYRQALKLVKQRTFLEKHGLCKKERMDMAKVEASTCQPNVTYAHDSKTCVCTNNGKYNFTVCDDMFLKDTIDLMPEAKKILRLGKNVIKKKLLNEFDDKREEQVAVQSDGDKNQISSEGSNETLNSIREGANKINSDSNSNGASDDEEDNIVGSRTQMPVYEKPESDEVYDKVNKQKGGTSDSNEKNTTPDTFNFAREAVFPKLDFTEDESNPFKKKIEQSNPISIFVSITNEQNQFWAIRRMFLRISLIFSIIIIYVSAVRHEKPVPAKLWGERCDKNSYVLNDCNWCWCDTNHRYKCHARACNQVDMFGHFNDAIRDIDVGMEGRGRWRSTDLACAPGVFYRRGSVLCVCNEDGYWPNPVCRDIFRILHSVEVTRGIEVTQKCEPTKLYLISCNVCFCPSTGLLNLEYCTKLTCSNEDPVMNATKVTEKVDDENDLEVYATCNATKKYSLGCQTCICLRNNRLLCDNCTSVHKIETLPQKNQSICGDHNNGEIFEVDCNLCFCDKEGSIYCTVKQCLRRYPIKKIDLLPLYTSTEAPLDDHECKPGTEYKKDCNICRCEIQNGRTVFSCTLKQCNAKKNIQLIENDCINGTIYERSCLICRCDEVQDIKIETCVADPRCTRVAGKEGVDTPSLELLHGYCKPLHHYKRECNTCKCVASGKILKCTTRDCKKDDPVIIDLVPVKLKHRDPCPKGGSYRLDCNVCFCLDNGNALCTTNDCENKYIN
ncbi:uncharacterized protein [Battus philenor]|uniref:uncharacterized protein n=1 Tax=Battus philenor TaxID=42288 RepID=UPI0035D0444D